MLFGFISMAVFLGFMAALFWGVADFFVGRASQALGAAKSALLVNGLGAIVYAIIYALFLHGGATYSGQGVIYALLGALFLGLAQASFFKAMSYGPIGLVSSIASTYPLVALFMSVLVFGGHITIARAVGIMLVVLGVMLASGLVSVKDSGKGLGRGPLIAMLPALGWGIGNGFLIEAMKVMDWEGVFLIELLTAPLVLLAVLPLIRGKEPVTVKSLIKGAKWPILWIACTTQMFGLLALNLGLSADPASGAVAVALSSCYPVLTIFLALRHMNEKIPFIPLAGGIAGVVGVVILALG